MANLFQLSILTAYIHRFILGLRITLPNQIVYFMQQYANRVLFIRNVVIFHSKIKRNEPKRVFCHQNPVFDKLNHLLWIKYIANVYTITLSLLFTIFDKADTAFNLEEMHYVIIHQRSVVGKLFVHPFFGRIQSKI